MSSDIPESEIREALDRLLESGDFARSRRMNAFLRFVVEEALADRGDILSAFSIAQQVYGRDESFDPRNDTIVRVDAGRLRRRLKRYYDTTGREDPLEIEIPVGTYVPQEKEQEKGTEGIIINPSVPFYL